MPIPTGWRKAQEALLAATPPVCDFGWQAPAFTLPATDGKSYTLADVAGPKGTLVMFICNHCPYVKAVTKELVEDSNELKKIGINTVAICSNDFINYPDDSFDNMIKFSKDNNFNFPYLHDETQEIAKKYGKIILYLHYFLKLHQFLFHLQNLIFHLYSLVLPGLLNSYLPFQFHCQKQRVHEFSLFD